MPDTHLPLHRAPTATEQLFPTLTAAQMARIATHGHRRDPEAAPSRRRENSYRHPLSGVEFVRLRQADAATRLAACGEYWSLNRFDVLRHGVGAIDSPRWRVPARLCRVVRWSRVETRSTWNRRQPRLAILCRPPIGSPHRYTTRVIDQPRQPAPWATDGQGRLLNGALRTPSNAAVVRVDDQGLTVEK